MSSDIGLIHFLCICWVCLRPTCALSLFNALSHQTNINTINFKELEALLIGEIKTERALHFCDPENKYDFASLNSCVLKYFKVEISLPSSSIQCVNIQLISQTDQFTPEVCFGLSGAFWYGGAELQYQRWPIQDTVLPMQPFVTNDIVPLNQSFGNVIDRRWINSLGYSIRVEENVPLSVSFNSSQNELCLQAFNDFYVLDRKSPRHANLQFEICKSNNILKTFTHLVRKPGGIPDARMFKSPIWSTWAKYKIHINESKVLEYADEIVAHGFSNSQIEIDDMFSSKYGDLDFTTEKFKQPTEMVKQLKANGFRVTVWITPFANLDSQAFVEGLEKGYWLKDVKGKVPALVTWWQGIGATLDVENEFAVDWFVERLKRMKEEYGIDSFKFDAGEVTYLPAFHEYSSTWTDPSEYTTKYVAAVSKLGPMIEVRCGYQTQKYPVFVRMGDKESRWGYDNGLRSIIPTILTMGIMGYPYILPDMIGGNGYVYDEEVDNPFINTELPERELYIRWLELTAYLPAMQFSFVPWQYDTEVIRIAQKFVDIHENIVTPLILDAASRAQETGTPLIRPLWMLSPNDINALECDSQFLIGNTLLVAPILEKGALSRDIYIPEGAWEDEQSGSSIQGPTWLYKYKVNIDEVPTFRYLL